MRNLLIDERVLYVLPSLVLRVGLERAIILQELHLMVKDDVRNVVMRADGAWIKATYDEWHKKRFRFWKPETIRKHFNRMVDDGLILRDQPELGKGIATLYVRINYALLDLDPDNGDASPTRTNVPDAPHPDNDAEGSTAQLSGCNISTFPTPTASNGKRAKKLLPGELPEPTAEEMRAGIARRKALMASADELMNDPRVKIWEARSREKADVFIAQLIVEEVQPGDADWLEALKYWMPKYPRSRRDLYKQIDCYKTKSFRNERPAAAPAPARTKTQQAPRTTRPAATEPPMPPSNQRTKIAELRAQRAAQRTGGQS